MSGWFMCCVSTLLYRFHHCLCFEMGYFTLFVVILFGLLAKNVVVSVKS